jgi:hypothetical protein
MPGSLIPVGSDTSPLMRCASAPLQASTRTPRGCCRTLGCGATPPHSSPTPSGGQLACSLPVPASASFLGMLASNAAPLLLALAPAACHAYPLLAGEPSGRLPSSGGRGTWRRQRGGPGPRWACCWLPAPSSRPCSCCARWAGTQRAHVFGNCSLLPIPATADISPSACPVPPARLQCGLPDAAMALVGACQEADLPLQQHNLETGELANLWARGQPAIQRFNSCAWVGEWRCKSVRQAGLGRLLGAPDVALSLMPTPRVRCRLFACSRGAAVRPAARGRRRGC